MITDAERIKIEAKLFGVAVEEFREALERAFTECYRERAEVLAEKRRRWQRLLDSLEWKSK